MWSTRFLWTGISSGVAIAILTMAALWVGLFAVSGIKNDPAWTIANIVKFTLPGPMVYPACWYAVIFRARDYSLLRTMVLVARTFITATAVVAIILIVGGAIAMLLTAKHLSEAAILVAATPLAYGLMTLIGAAILFVPYFIVATPMAMFHRWLLLRIFASPGPPSRGPTAFVQLATRRAMTSATGTTSQRTSRNAAGATSIGRIDP